MPRRFNCCVFNHPCPIFCPINLPCSNDVQNPILSGEFAFLNNNLPGSIAENAIIPLGLQNYFGNFAVPSDGGVSLSAGTYEINYFAGGVVPSSGTLQIGLFLNGVVVLGSVITATTDVGSAVNLTRTIVVNVPLGGILQLVNLSSQSADFNFASMFIRQL